MQQKISTIIPSAPYRSPQAVIENLQQIRPANLEFEILVIKGTWPPLQRNLGIDKATGDYIFFFDDDIIIPAGSIENALKTFDQNPKIQAVGGPNLTPKANSFIQHCIGQALSSFFTGLDTCVRYYQAKPPGKVNENHLITCNLAFRKNIIKENLFNPELYENEENELLGRILRKGNQLAYNPEFYIYHHRRKNIFLYLKQIFNWGKGRTLHSFKQPKHFSFVFFVPAIFLLYLIDLVFYHPTWYIYPLFLYTLINLFFSIKICLEQKKITFFFVMPWLFLLTHLSYACGTIYGLFKIKTKKELPDPKSFELIVKNFK